VAGQTGIDIASFVSRNEQTILPEWVELQKKAGILHIGRIPEGELQSQSRSFLH
jgi:rsbT co-antagonist protein RsbR